MDLKKYIAQLENLAALLGNEKEILNRCALPAAKEFEGVYKKRVFVMGLDTKGRKIGSYSTKAFYVGKASKSLIGLPKSKFTPQGKNGKSTFKNGRKKKTRYLKNGYKEFRERAGRQSKTVDLNLSGSLFTSMQIGIKGDKINFGFTDPKSVQKAIGNERRFRRVIFTPSQNELQVFAGAATREVQKLIKDILK